MKINSPLANFIEVLHQVNQTATQYGDKLRSNEAATRAALIDPILIALGWNPTRPDMIEFEKVYIDTRVDYALLDHDGKVRAIVEAKALGGNLSDTRITTKLLSYGFTYGIQEVVLTDGISWQFFSQSTPGNVTPESRVISKDDLVSCADYFIMKLDASRFWQDSPFEISMPTPVPIETTLSKPIPQMMEAKIQPSVGPTDRFTLLDSLKQNLKGEPAPKSLRLPDGKVVAINYWRDILVECVKFVLSENDSIQIPLADKAAKKIQLINNSSRGISGTYIELPYKGQTVYVYLNYDTNHIILNARYILGYLPKNKNWQPVAVELAR